MSSPWQTWGLILRSSHRIKNQNVRYDVSAVQSLSAVPRLLPGNQACVYLQLADATNLFSPLRKAKGFNQKSASGVSSRMGEPATSSSRIWVNEDSIMPSRFLLKGMNCLVTGALTICIPGTVYFPSVLPWMASRSLRQMCAKRRIVQAVRRGLDEQRLKRWQRSVAK